MDSGTANRFLELIGAPNTRPSLEHLSSLVKAFLFRIPFENVSKLYRRAKGENPEIPVLAEYLDGIARHHFGGTCYTNNYYLHLLLCHLGYEVKLCGADMNHPDVHIVNIVRIDERDYLVDVGYAAPLLWPIPLDLDHAWEYTLGRDRFVVCRQTADGRAKLQMFRDGLLRHGYAVNPARRRIEEFAEVVADSFSGRATFMNALLVVRFFEHRSLAINNLDLIESTPYATTVTKVVDKAALPKIIKAHFNIPIEISTIALTVLGELGDAWN